MTDTESTKPVQEEEHTGLSRRGFLGSSAVTGAGLPRFLRLLISGGHLCSLW